MAQTAKADDDDAFPCKLTISIPLPTKRLATAALRSLAVDAELSPLVRRHFSLATPASAATFTTSTTDRFPQGDDNAAASVLVTRYAATNNRMLRVAVNGFFESVGVALQVMQDLDVDVVHGAVREGLERVQGLEETTGEAVGGT